MGLDSLTFAGANGVGPGLAELAYARGEPGAAWAGGCLPGCASAAALARFRERPGSSGARPPR